MSMTTRQYAAQLRRAATRLPGELAGVMGQTTLYTEGRLRRRLSGAVLKARSTDLRSSIKSRAVKQGNATGITISVGSAAVKYAAIHESGGVIKAKTSKGLRFRGRGGKWVTKRQVRIPRRPYFAPSMEEGKRFMDEAAAQILPRLLG